MFNAEQAALALSDLHEAGSTVKSAETYIGGLSKASKMPWYSWSISATECKTGGMLAASDPDSVCARCYALKGNYRWPVVAAAHKHRLAMYQASPTIWAASMAYLLRRKSKGKMQFFRWFDSGDLQDVDMLRAIMWIARQTPNVWHWVPTKEYGIVMSVSADQLPRNLVLRVSHPKVGGRYSERINGHPTSSVGYEPSGMAAALYNKATGQECPAYEQGGTCGTCRECWDGDVANVNYKEH
jgi:hypothetical protein